MTGRRRVGSAEMLRLMDATPVPRRHPVNTAKRPDLYGRAGHGYCPSHSRWYRGAARAFPVIDLGGDCAAADHTRLLRITNRNRRGTRHGR